MPNYVKNTIKTREEDLVKAFACGVPNCFAAYKKTANLNRVYVKYNFKERKKTRAQSTLDKIKREAHDNLT